MTAREDPKRVLVSRGDPLAALRAALLKIGNAGGQPSWYLKDLLENCPGVDFVGILGEVMLAGSHGPADLVRMNKRTLRSMFSRHPHLCHVLLCCGAPVAHPLVLDFAIRHARDVGLVELVFQAGITPECPHLVSRLFGEGSWETMVETLDFLLTVGPAGSAVVEGAIECLGDLRCLETLVRHGFGPSMWRHALGRALYTKSLPLIEHVVASGVADTSVAWFYCRDRTADPSIRDAFALLLGHSICGTNPTDLLSLDFHTGEPPYRDKGRSEALRMKLDFGALEVAHLPLYDSVPLDTKLLPLVTLLRCHLHNRVTDTDTSLLLPSWPQR